MIAVDLRPGSRIYNLEGDLRVAVENAYRKKGIDCVKDFNGMFALDIWDSDKGVKYIVRDRYGIKLAYYRVQSRAIVWAERIAPVLTTSVGHTIPTPTINLQALAQYFTFQNILDDQTFYKGVHLLPPGCYLKWSDGGEKIEVVRYWDYNFDSGLMGADPREVAEEVRRLLVQAVERQLTPDIGCFLSGGMDSGSIALIAARTVKRMNTFTVGFDVSTATGMELGFDETESAEFMANHLKTVQSEAILHAGDMEAVLPELMVAVEEPRMGQCYPDWYAARLASKFVKVVLLGGGGDEMFGGYPWRYYHGAGATSLGEYERGYYNYWQRLVPDNEKSLLFQPDFYRQMAGYETFEVFKGALCQLDHYPTDMAGFVNQSMRLEASTFLHGLFVIADKIGGAMGLEARYPFMDNDLVDFAMRIPPEMKIHRLGSTEKPQVDEDDVLRLFLAEGGKMILREAMKGLVPDRILARHKQGFSAPDGAWFRGDSMDYIRDLFVDGASAMVWDYLRPEYVNARIAAHYEGKVNNRLFIWSVLSFEWWLREVFGK